MAFRGRDFLLCFVGVILARPAQANILQTSIAIVQPPDAASLATVAMFANAWRNSFVQLSSFTFAGFGNDSVDVNYPSGLSIDSVTFSGTAGYLYVRQEPAADYYGSNFLYGPPESNGQITIALPPGVHAVGWSWGNFYDIQGTTITFSDGESFTQSGIFGFVGFTSPLPITSFEISSPTFPVVYGEFSVGETPEPSCALLLFGGISALISIRRIRALLAGPE